MVWAIFESSKKIGDENDKEFQELEISTYLKSYLENPDRFILPIIGAVVVLTFLVPLTIKLFRKK